MKIGPLNRLGALDVLAHAASWQPVSCRPAAGAAHRRAQQTPRALRVHARASTSQTTVHPLRVAVPAQLAAKLRWGKATKLGRTPSWPRRTLKMLGDLLMQAPALSSGPAGLFGDDIAACGQLAAGCE